MPPKNFFCPSSHATLAPGLPRPFLYLASREFVLDSRSLALDFFVSLALASSLVSSNPPLMLIFRYIIVIVITFLFTKLPWPWDSEGAFRSPRQAATGPPVYHTRRRFHFCPFYCWTSSREAVNTNFYSLWFDSAGNRTWVYHISSRRSIHSTIISITNHFWVC